MKTIPVRRMLDFTAHDFISRLANPVNVEYEDGVTIEHTANELAVNRVLLTVLEGFKDVPIISTYNAQAHYSSGMYVSSTINKAFECMLEGIVCYVRKNGMPRSVLEPVYERMMSAVEYIYNEIICNNLEYVSSLDITDFLDIQLDPRLMSAIDNVRVKKDLTSIEKCYEVLDTVIRTRDDLVNNPIAKGYISGSISANQVKQLLGSRGFVTEIDSSIFKYPIASSFVLGMSDMYEMAVESRSGAKALYLSNRAISLSEYFAREMQLVTMGVESLVDGDCGNREYIEWVVQEDDFKNLLGLHYFTDNGEMIIGVNDRHLIGTTIKLRNLIKCKSSNKRHVCTACFGELSYNVPTHANLGHICTTILTAILTQLILSTKHITTSASSDTVVLNGHMKDFFIMRNRSGSATYTFRSGSISKRSCKYRLHIAQDSAPGLSDIGSSTNIHRLNITRVSSIRNIVISVEEPDGTVSTYPMDISQGNRNASFSIEFLKYVLKHGYEIDEMDRYVIDLSEWKHGTSFAVLPQVEFSYIHLAMAIKKMFKSMREDPNNSPEALLHTLFDTVNAKLDINLAMMQVIVYAYTAADPGNHNYDMARNSDTGSPAKIRSIMTNRSLGGAYAWESGMYTIHSPISFNGNNAVDHPLDVMLMPNEVLLDYNGSL